MRYSKAWLAARWMARLRQAANNVIEHAEEADRVTQLEEEKAALEAKAAADKAALEAQLAAEAQARADALAAAEAQRLADAAATAAALQAEKEALAAETARLAAEAEAKRIADAEAAAAALEAQRVAAEAALEAQRIAAAEEAARIEAEAQAELAAEKAALEAKIAAEKAAQEAALEAQRIAAAQEAARIEAEAAARLAAEKLALEQAMAQKAAEQAAAMAQQEAEAAAALAAEKAALESQMAQAATDAAATYLPKTGKSVDSDKLDGIDSSGFLRSTAKAADSNLLDGIDSSGFLRSTGKAVDADKLDGYDWMQSGKNIRGSDIYADNWFRNYNSGEGLYNEGTGAHWVSDANASWTMRDSASSIRMRMKTNGTSERGSVYADNANAIGFLDAGGSWAVKHVNDNGTYFYTDGTTEEFKVGRDAVSGNYGTVQTSTNRGGWGGYSIAGKYVFMSDHSSTAGVYNDVDNEWMQRWIRNGATHLYYNGSDKFQTTSTGANINGELTINGSPLKVSSSSFTGLRTTSNGTLELFKAADGDSVDAEDWGQWYSQDLDLSVDSNGHLILTV